MYKKWRFYGNETWQIFMPQELKIMRNFLVIWFSPRDEKRWEICKKRKRSSASSLIQIETNFYIIISSYWCSYFTSSSSFNSNITRTYIWHIRNSQKKLFFVAYMLILCAQLLIFFSFIFMVINDFSLSFFSLQIWMCTHDIPKWYSS